MNSWGGALWGGGGILDVDECTYMVFFFLFFFGKSCFDFSSRPPKHSTL